jgi:hypothetical protein
MQSEERKQKALNILVEMGLENLDFLGQGEEGVVFCNADYVYKVFCPLNEGREKLEKFRCISHFLNAKYFEHIYLLDNILERNSTLIIRYVHEDTEPCKMFCGDEIVGFLAECWRNKMVIKDCKPDNFVRVSGKLKLIDFEAYDYTDNLFLNMCVRAYIYANYNNRIDSFSLKKLLRTAINNFDLPELQGVREFVNKVFATIIYQESLEVINGFKLSQSANNEVYTAKSLPNLERLFFAKLRESRFISAIDIESVKLNDDLYFEPDKIQISYMDLNVLNDKVTLLIKTCPQDILTIEENVKHIVKQLSVPNPFYEVVVSIDTKERGFLREYNSSGSLSGLIEIVQKLIENKIIDRYIVYDETKTEDINLRWFGLKSEYAHTSKNAPVSSQVYAFEQCKGDYVLQCDCDVLIGRRDYGHSFLSDMISELKKNEKVISVGFNICNNESKAYFGFDNGGFVPEVRFCLFERKRLFDLRPFPNSVDSKGRLQFSWFRSVEQFQKQTGYCSIRGGDSRSFYIHPQNYRKTKPYAWMTILDRTEQLKIPAIQYGGFDCDGSLYDWCIPKRSEKMVVVSCFRNVSVERFLRFWCSLMSQKFQDFGVILYDDCSDNGIQLFIEKLMLPYSHKVTFVKGRNRNERMANEYLCIRDFCDNPQSVIVMVDGDDAIVGNEALLSIWEKYEKRKCDVVIGRMHQTYRLQPHYRYPVNFISPRESNGGNVWQHIKSFKKYLFDSIPISYFKHKTIDNVKSINKWLEQCDDYAMMIPIVEMSRLPLQMDFINYYYERDYENRNADRDLKEKCIAEIINKPKLSQNDAFVGQRLFRPDFERIEIDLTYDCNLKCFGCNRSCAQMPTTEQIELQDIERFISDSIKVGKKWKQINVLGGEPTLHKNFENIVGLLQQYADVYSQDTVIQVVSNGVLESSRKMCENVKTKFKNVVIDYGSYKTNNKVEYFSSFNDAPIDDVKYENADFTKACWVTNYCGIGLASRGYYACALCGGIDRVLNEFNGVKSFAELSEEKLKEHYNKFCRLCGNFKAYALHNGNYIPHCEKEPFKNIISETWRKIYGNQT